MDSTNTGAEGRYTGDIARQYEGGLLLPLSEQQAIPKFLTAPFSLLCACFCFGTSVRQKPIRTEASVMDAYGEGALPRLMK